MQSLSAHIRLLLDTPEHLWRLLEQKKFLHASWLFLLARVVHRSLANNDADDDDGLHTQGLDILVHTHLWHYETALTSFAGAISYRSEAMGHNSSVQISDHSQGHLVPARDRPLGGGYLCNTTHPPSYRLETSLGDS
jgi:hypothetical protein